MNEFNFEVYVKNPVTGENGWDIMFVSVFADTKEEAKQYLKKWELFDCIILFNFWVENETNFKKGDIINSNAYHQYKLGKVLNY